MTEQMFLTPGGALIKLNKSGTWSITSCLHYAHGLPDISELTRDQAEYMLQPPELKANDFMAMSG